MWGVKGRAGGSKGDPQAFGLSNNVNGWWCHLLKWGIPREDLGCKSLICFVR